MLFFPGEEDIGIVLGVTTDVFIGIVVSVFLMCLACVLSLAVCLCRRDGEMYGMAPAYGAYGYPTGQPQTLLAPNTPILPHTASYTGKNIKFTLD